MAAAAACLEENAVVAFVEGELDADAAAQVEAHLDTCDRCRALVAELARVFPDLAPSGDPRPEELESTGVEEEDDDTALPLPRGATVGRYVVLDLVGAGAMGLVHAAYDPELDRRVALKLLRQRSLDASQRARLVREARAAARLSHPNVIVVHDVGEHEGTVFITMEFVDGSTLGEWLTAESRREREILDVFAAAGRGLAAAHQAGIVHRDFKPANVLVGRGPSPVVRVTDFGLARPQIDRERPTITATSPALVQSGQAMLQSLTQTGALVGTPAYMSPEQLEGKPADERSDQFSFCVALYEALCGKRPFAGKSFAELSTNVCEGRLQDRAALGSLRVGLRRALDRGLQVDPAARFGSMPALLAAIEPPRRRRLGPVLGAAALAGGSAWALASIADEPPCDRGASRIDAVWNEALLDDTEAAFARSELPYQEHALATTRTALDSYAAAWRATYVDACEAHRRGEQSADLLDRRMACLEERRDAMRAIVEILVDADAVAVERAPEAAHALPPVGACSDVAALREVVPPPSPELAPEVEALRASIANARARASLGHAREALGPARDAWERAQQIDYAPMQARAAFMLAENERAVNPGEQRDELYVDAFALALEGRDDRLAAMIVMFMLENHATAEHARDPEVDHWLRVSEALVARLGDDSDVQGNLLHVQSLIARERGELAEARQYAAREVELARAADHPGRERVAVAITQLAHIDYQLGDYARAQELFEEALVRDLDVHGEGHPDTAISEQNIAAAQLAQGKHADALPHLRRVLATREALYGDDAPQLLSVLQNLSNALAGTGDHEGSLAAIERAVAIATAKYGAGDPMTESVREQLGASYFQAGRYDDARRVYEAALARLTERLPAGDVTVALARHNLAEAFLELGRFDDASREAAQAHAVFVASFAPDHPYLGFSLTLLGHIALARGDTADARNLLEQALAVRNKAQGTVIERATTKAFLGLALRSSDPTRSAALLDEARAAIDGERGPEATRLRAVLQSGAR